MSSQNNKNGRVKNKFFNEDLFKDASQENMAANTGGQVINWGVGGNKPKNNVPSNDVNILDSTQVINFISSEPVVDPSNFSHSLEGQSVFNKQQTNYSNNIDDVINSTKFDASVNNSSLSNQFAQQNPTFYGYNADPNLVQSNNVQTNNGVSYQPVQADPNFMNNNQINGFQQAAPVTTPFMQPNSMNDYNMSSNMNQQNPLFAEQVNNQGFNSGMGERELNPMNLTSSAAPIDPNLISNQPLSFMALSGESTEESLKAKDVLENNKYFQNTPDGDNRFNVSEVVPATLAPAVDVLAEPPRDLNMKELILSYVGKEYKNISMSPFSIWGCLFGPLYYFYRNMYVYGAILFVIYFGITCLAFINPWLFLGAYAICLILVGLVTNSLYLSFAQGEAKRIALANPKLSQYELQKICAAKGGTSMAGLAMALLINVLSTGVFNKLGGEELINQYMNMGVDQKLNVDTTTTLDQVIEYAYPSMFIEAKENPGYYIYYETKMINNKEETFEACGVNINLITGYQTSRALIQHMADTDKRYNRVSDFFGPHNERWSLYDYTKEGVHTSYYARDFGDNIVLISYAASNHASEGTCDNYLSEIMNSIKAK